MFDFTKTVRGKVVRILVVEHDDCITEGVPWGRIRAALLDAEDKRQAQYSVIEVPKPDRYYGIKVREYSKVKKYPGSLRTCDGYAHT